MTENKKWDVIIVGGSYAGLAAGMSLGRAIRNVLIIDSGKPCNAQTPHSHNFLTRDGITPAELATIAREQVLAYPSVQILNGTATAVSGTNGNFVVETEAGQEFHTRKVLFATGVRDLIPEIPGVRECWGISVIHCPYCHGYEVRNEKTGIWINGSATLEFASLIRNWTPVLTILTNGEATFDADTFRKLDQSGIPVNQSKIAEIIHTGGYLDRVCFEDGSSLSLKAIYARFPFEQHCDIPEQMGCDLTEHGYISTDHFKKTSVEGIYAAGDNSIMMRSVANVVAAGSMAGAIINKELIDVI
jgi:thioredoxin reductase